MGGPAVDVLQRLGTGRFSFESPEDPDDRKQRHRVESVLVVAGLALVAIILALGAYMALQAGDADVRKGGVGIVTSTLTGVLGFIAGRGSK